MARTGQLHSSRYDHDPRVTHLADGTIAVTVGALTYSVRWMDVFAWMVIDPSTGQFLQVAADDRPQGFGFAINLDTADDAISVLLGEPQQ